jgi:hypothetical protein
VNQKKGSKGRYGMQIEVDLRAGWLDATFPAQLDPDPGFAIAKSGGIDFSGAIHADPRLGIYE